MSVAGLLFTGGASRRLGSPKAELRLHGERLVDRGARVLASVCEPVLEVGPGFGGSRAVREHPPGAGPLAALGAGGDALRAAGFEGAVIALAVDLPFVEPPLLAWLAAHPAVETLVPRVGGIPQTLCARYSSEATGRVTDLLADGERSLRALLDVVPVLYLDEDAWRDVVDARAFDDVDTPQDAARAGVEQEE